MPQKILEKIVAAPAEGLEKTWESAESAAHKLAKNRPIKKAGEYWSTLGPGLTTGAADDDPSGIATYSQTGARYGLNLLWLSLFSFPLMAVVQEMCARIGLVTGRGLAGNIRRHYPAKILYLSALLLFAANTFNIGADLGAMAKATQLLWPNLNFYILVIVFTAISLTLQIFVSYKHYAKYLKWLALVLLSYVLSAFFVNLHIDELLYKTFVPTLHFNREELLLVCGILGTTISPYLFFWQTSQEVEEQINGGKTSVKLRQSEVTGAELKKMRTDVWSGMFFSNLTMFFIIVTCSAALYQNGITNIQTAADAAAALKPIAGNFASLLFAVGIIGVGLLAVPVLAGSTAYAVSEAMGWREGLYLKLKQAYPFYGAIIISMILGMLLNFTGLDPIKGLLYAAVLNGLVSPVILILIVQISDNPKIMGMHKNSNAAKALGWLVTMLMIIVGVSALGALIMPK